MDSTKTNDAVQLCEDILLKERNYNVEHKIWPSVNEVIDRMLGRGLELNGVYCELQAKLHDIPRGIETFLDSVLGVTTVWYPEAISEQRASRERLVEINSLIEKLANELADLIDERTEISCDSGFYSDCRYHIGDVLEKAGESNHLFGFWLKEPLGQLKSEFGVKYWPEISDVVRTLAADALQAEVKASDTITEAATSAKRSSSSDFVRALYVALAERNERNNGRLPNEFRLTDSSMASLVNCLLDLDADEIIDGPYIKGFRQRDRRASVTNE